MGRKPIVVMSLICVAVVAAYLGWTFYQRGEGNRNFEKMKQQKELEAARRFRKAYGNDDVKFVGFNARPAEIRAGQNTVLCYGVLNAKTVKLDPPIEKVHPALSYCFDATFSKTTTLTLTAEDAGGNSVQKSLTITVR